MTVRSIVLGALLLLASIHGAGAGAATGCPDAQMFSGRLITDICWGCIFPIKISGISLFGSSNSIPADAADQAICICPVKGDPIPKIGPSMGLWEPARLVELVRASGCAPSLGGIKLPLSDVRQQGNQGNRKKDTADLGFYHSHTYAFPLLIMLDLLVNQGCVSDGYMDFDMMFLTEVDPTWNNDELGFFQQPEAVLVSNPLAVAACAIDGTATTAGYPIDEMWWCAGTWGTMYPFSGHVSGMEGMPKQTALLATKTLAVAHRRGLSWRTMGDDALCGAQIDPMMPKSQYKLSMFFPQPMANNATPIGRSTFLWGEHRKIPAVGEDAVYVIFRWADCCLGIP